MSNAKMDQPHLGSYRAPTSIRRVTRLSRLHLEFAGPHRGNSVGANCKRFYLSGSWPSRRKYQFTACVVGNRLSREKFSNLWNNLLQRSLFKPPMMMLLSNLARGSPSTFTHCLPIFITLVPKDDYPWSIVCFRSCTRIFQESWPSSTQFWGLPSLDTYSIFLPWTVLRIRWCEVPPL